MADNGRFFVVSGYLITSTTLRHHGSLGHVDLRSFVLRGAMPEVYKLPAMGFFVAASVVVAWGVARFCSEPMNARLRGLLLRRVR